MARSLVFCLSKTYLSPAPSTRSSFRLLPYRSLSNDSSHSDIADEASTDPLLRKLEDAVHLIIARRSAPDWLPFLPGYSYWVPPPRSTGSLGIAQLVERLANPLSQEESLSTTTVRGWPSSDYFVKGSHPHPMEVERTSKKVEMETTSNNLSKSEDEE